MFFDYEKPKKTTLEDYEVVREGELFIPPHQWIEMVENFDKEDIIAYLSTKIEGLPFPHTKYTPQEIKANWLKIKQEDNHLIESYWSLDRCEIKTEHTYKGKYLYLNATNNGLKVSNQFTEPFRLETSHKSIIGPLRQWTREGFRSKRRVFFRPYWGMINASEGISSKNLKRAIEVSCYKATQFKPSCAKTLYNFFGAKRVLDFSAGWGDRLVGFHASKAESYIGIDPNSKLHEPYQSISHFCNTGKETKFICSPAEEADLTGVKVDFVFTSPPYFDTEIYSQEPTQSTSKYPELEDWKKHFLFKTLEKCWEVLEEGGRIALNISDRVKDNTRICQPTIHFMESLGAKYEGVVGYKISNRNTKRQEIGSEFCEPIFIWSKGEAPEPKWTQDNFFGV